MEKSEALPAKPNHNGYTLIQKILMALTLLLAIRFAWILIPPEVPSLKESKDDMFFSTTAKFIFAGWPRSITSTLDYESRTALLQEKKQFTSILNGRLSIELLELFKMLV